MKSIDSDCSVLMESMTSAQPAAGGEGPLVGFLELQAPNQVPGGSGTGLLSGLAEATSILLPVVVSGHWASGPPTSPPHPGKNAGSCH